jgi:hypothetical protein
MTSLEVSKPRVKSGRRFLQGEINHGGLLIFFQMQNWGRKKMIIAIYNHPWELISHHSGFVFFGNTA